MLTITHISIPLGIVIGLLASFVQSLGLTIQRKSHVVNQSLPEHRQRVEHRRPLWLLGFAVFISSNVIGSFVQIASLPVVILAPLGAVSLLWNAFFARLLLGDVFSPWMILGTILIAGGAILIAFFGIVPEQTRSLEDLLHLFRRPTFIAYFSVLGVTVLICLVITHLTEYSISRRIKAESVPDSPTNFSPPSSAIHLPTHSTNTTTGLTEAVDDNLLSHERTPLVDPKALSQSSRSNSPRNDSDLTGRSINRTRLLVAISYASFSGIISGMCLLFAKSGVELLLLTLGGNNQFWRWEAWVLVLGLIIFAVLQLWYLHKALILADPTLVCPSAFCFYNLSSIVNGLVYFDQFSLIRPLYLGLVALGIVILLGGVWVVSIQSGGGGVDVGPWVEETIKLTGEDEALYSEPTYTDADNEASEVHALSDQPTETTPPPKPGVGPVPMERETRSESYLPNIQQPSLVGLGIDMGSPESTLPGKTQSSISTPDKRTIVDTQLYPSPRTPSRPAKRKPTADINTSSSSIHHPHAHGHSRTQSYQHAHHGLPSPPLGSVSALGPGFQIGLSPLSPGFTITPLERRRRTSAMGGGGSTSFADVVSEAMAREQGRRRTVSEGEVTREPVGGSAASVVADGDANVQHTREDSRREDLRVRNASTRWKWLKHIFEASDD
ncbi:hypothetical protein JR316_0001004 [Psilocybe cubensis]|uniref:Uncharacterized protein n=2 Tax=Psilocybe cubensis TaxID=181762 RepID=A0ACB8HG98_PSICU|nr:hypothetical protein JR316_0001004 [Psilocybe cubensis]KAH9486938.1 hypothetical protein JR316_0001004 [Psilocybe cubensis]